MMTQSTSPPPSSEAREGARERLQRLGAEALSDEELVAILLGTGTSGANVRHLACELLDRYGGLGGLANASAHGLASVRGVGPSKSARLAAAIEMGRRVVARPLIRGQRFLSSRDVDAALRPRLAKESVEHFLAIPLDARNRPMGELRLARGGLSACPVMPADVFGPLLRQAASGVIFVHNHPSGSPDPSSEDAELTRRLVQAGDILGIRVLDHIIIAQEGFFSFLDAGWMHEQETPS